MNNPSDNYAVLLVNSSAMSNAEWNDLISKNWLIHSMGMPEDGFEIHHDVPEALEEAMNKDIKFEEEFMRDKKGMCCEEVL